MGRRSKDLFELLQMRARGTTPPSRARGRGRWRFDVLGTVRGWVDGILPRRKRSRSRRGSGGGRSRGVVLSGPLLTAALVAALGVGFALGRTTAPSGAQAGGKALNRSTQAERPQQFPAKASFPREVWRDAPPDMSAQKEVETLSDMLYVVLHFPAAARKQASDLAYHLRMNGLVNARIKSMRDSTGPRWAVLLYILRRENAESQLEKLRNVPAPSFLPDFTRRVARTTMQLKRPKRSE